MTDYARQALKYAYLSLTIGAEVLYNTTRAKPMALDNLSLDKPVPPFPDSVQTLALSPAGDNYTHLKEGRWKKEEERFRRRLAQASLRRNKKEAHMRNRKKQCLWL